MTAEEAKPPQTDEEIKKAAEKAKLAEEEAARKKKKRLPLFRRWYFRLGIMSIICGVLALVFAVVGVLKDIALVAPGFAYGIVFIVAGLFGIKSAKSGDRDFMFAHGVISFGILLIAMEAYYTIGFICASPIMIMAILETDEVPKRTSIERISMYGLMASCFFAGLVACVTVVLVVIQGIRGYRPGPERNPIKDEASWACWRCDTQNYAGCQICRYCSREGGWPCWRCSQWNGKDEVVCTACQMTRVWFCPGCGGKNIAEVTKCRVCNIRRSWECWKCEERALIRPTLQVCPKCLTGRAWYCMLCGLPNDAENTNCMERNCQTPRPWYCSKCAIPNPAEITNCSGCNIARRGWYCVAWKPCPEDDLESKAEAVYLKQQYGERMIKWCPCDQQNDPGATLCVKCQIERPWYCMRCFVANEPADVVCPECMIERGCWFCAMCRIKNTGGTKICEKCIIARVFDTDWDTYVEQFGILPEPEETPPMTKVSEALKKT